MNVLWITNHPVGEFARQLGQRYSSGSWLEATSALMNENTNITLYQASIGPVKELIKQEINGITYFCVPRTSKKIYDYKSPKNKKFWKRIIDMVCPDIIMVWGTEYAHGYCAMTIAPNVPKVLMVQGVLNAVEKYYYSGMTVSELRSAYTFRDLLKRDSIANEKKMYKRKSAIEVHMLKEAKNIIVENQWARANIRCLSPKANFYEFRQPVMDLFYNYQWDPSACKRNTIFCTSPVGYPIKGFHQLLKALYIIKQTIPSIHLRVPGISNPCRLSLKERLKQKGYNKYLCRLIKQYQLENNLTFLGPLSAREIAEELVACNVFVVPSAIENLSISFREAQIVGVPCVVSMAGGMPETANEGKAALVYRFEEEAQLADEICRILLNDKLSVSLSRNGSQFMKEYLSEYCSVQDLISIYGDILS